MLEPISARKSITGRWTDVESFLSYPAISCSRIAQSSAVQAIGPAQSSEWESGIIPARLQSPKVGLRPASPQSAAGPRMEPPESEAGPPRISPAATAAAVPEDEPPVKCS